MPDEGSFGEPSFSYPEDSDSFSPGRIRRFSQSVLSPEAWFRTADELIAAMDLLELHVERFWKNVRSLAFAADATSDAPSKPPEKSDAPSNQQNSGVKHSLINQQMMLAGFAIENLCKGYLAVRLSDEQRERIQQEGNLPKSLQDHDSLNLVEQTGMTLCDTEKNLLNRITDAVVWLGRYPSLTSDKKIEPFAQSGSDVLRIRTFYKNYAHMLGPKIPTVARIRT